MTLAATVLMFALSQKAHPPKPQHLDFDPQEIVGGRDAPEIGDIYVRRPTKFSNLIKIRDNFADKIVKSVDQM